MKLKILKHPSYTYKKNNIYYFVRSIPKDLSSHYEKGKFVKSLRTKSRSQALKASQLLAAKLDEQWFRLRLINDPDPLISLRVAGAGVGESSCMSLTEALEQYVDTKGGSRDTLFVRAASRNCSYLRQAVGEKNLDCYTTKDAVAFRDWLKSRNLSGASIHRIFGSIKAILNFSIHENGFQFANPFVGTYLPSSLSTKSRKTLNRNELKLLEQSCRALDDDMRWLFALIIDTGMRLSKAVGLEVSDLKLEDDFPHVDLKPNYLRRLKTDNSHRRIPLVGSSYWAATRIRDAVEEGACFPRYLASGKLSSNSASASLNKWLKSVLNGDYVVHGLRHTFRDRLRDVGAPMDLIDQLGGWSNSSIGQSYGSGYSFESASHWMEKIVLES